MGDADSDYTRLAVDNGEAGLGDQVLEVAAVGEEGYCEVVVGGAILAEGGG